MKLIFAIIILVISYSFLKSSKKNDFDFVSYIISLPLIKNDTISNSVDTMLISKTKNFFMVKKKVFVILENDTNVIIKFDYDYYIFDDVKKIGLFYKAKNPNPFYINVDSFKKTISYFSLMNPINESDVFYDSIYLNDILIKKYINLKKDFDKSYPDTTFLAFDKSFPQTTLSLSKTLDSIENKKLVKFSFFYKRRNFKEKFDLNRTVIFQIIPYTDELKNKEIQIFKKGIQILKTKL